MNQNHIGFTQGPLIATGFGLVQNGCGLLRLILQSYCLLERKKVQYKYMLYIYYLITEQPQYQHATFHVISTASGK